MKKVIRMFPLVSILLITSLWAEAGEWENITYEKGITVQRKEIPGSNHLAFRGFGTVNAPVIDILSVLGDYKKHKEWIGNSLGSKELARDKNGNYIFYTATKAPWPLQDRDFVGKGKMRVNKKKKTIVISSRETTHPAMPPRDDRTRMPFVRVTWYFRPLKKYKGQKTWVSFTVHADPGGIIPAWVANMVSKKIPFDTLDGMRRRVSDKDNIPDEFLERYAEFKNWY